MDLTKRQARRYLKLLKDYKHALTFYGGDMLLTTNSVYSRIRSVDRAIDEIETSLKGGEKTCM